MSHKPSSSDPSSEERIRRLVERYEEELRKQLKHGVRPLHEIEDEIESIGETVKKDLLKEITQEMGTGYVGSRCRCHCGASAKYTNCARRCMITVHAVMDLRRAYYYCASCRKGFCPLDEHLQIGSGELSRRVQALLARFSSHLPFQSAAAELEAVCGVRVSATAVGNYSKQIGQRIAAGWAQSTKDAFSHRAPSSGLHPKRLYISMDGVMAHVGGKWQEAKLGATYQRNPRGEGVIGTRYYATMDRSQAFGRKLRVMAHQSGSDNCADIAVVADGAPWIWKETGKHFPQSVQVLDYYHVTEHLWAVAQAWFGEGSAASKEWMRVQADRLMADQLPQVIDAVMQWQPRPKKKKEIRRRLLAYLSEHSHRMTYRTLRDQGYHIGSGIIEAGAKSVIKRRMSGTGMRWGETGAESMLHLTAQWNTDQSDNFFRFTA